MRVPLFLIGSLLSVPCLLAPFGLKNAKGTRLLSTTALQEDPIIAGAHGDRGDIDHEGR
jgi:hypothetical protein